MLLWTIWMARVKVLNYIRLNCKFNWNEIEYYEYPYHDFQLVLKLKIKGDSTWKNNSKNCVWLNYRDNFIGPISSFTISWLLFEKNSVCSKLHFQVETLHKSTQYSSLIDIDPLNGGATSCRQLCNKNVKPKQRSHALLV